jgi:hypothetical protein
VLLLLVAAFLGRSDGQPNYLSGKIIGIQGIDPKKQVYVVATLSTGQQLKKTHTVFGDRGQFGSRFRFALPVKMDFKREAVVFEVFSASDTKSFSLGTTEIAMDVLKERFPESVTRDLKSSDFSLSVQIGLASVHAFFLHFDRFRRALFHNIRLLSFWTRLFALPVALWIAYDGLSRFRSGGRTGVYVQGLGQTVLGLYFLWFSVPFYLGYIGISVLDKFKNESLTFAWGSALSISGYLAATHNWLLKDKEVTIMQRLVHIPLGLVAVGYFLADIRGEPGSGWLAWIGKAVLGRLAYKGDKE